MGASSPRLEGCGRRYPRGLALAADASWCLQAAEEKIYLLGRGALSEPRQLIYRRRGRAAEDPHIAPTAIMPPSPNPLPTGPSPLHSSGLKGDRPLYLYAQRREPSRAEFPQTMNKAVE